MRHRIILLFFAVYPFLLSQAAAQCNLHIDAGEDITVCSSEHPQLNASATGTVLYSRWLPAQGLDNVLSLYPTVTEPSNITYQLTVHAYDEQQNLLVNSDFEQGDTGFSSQYEDGSTKPGGYIIGKLGTELFAEAKACEDHTTGTGDMMMVKVSDSENLKIWCQEVTVNPQQDYHFVAFATGLRINNPPIILLHINDELLSSGTLGSFACSWQRVKGDWNSGNNTKAEICLSVSDEDIGAATDFALDDLGFFEVCELKDEVNVEVIPLEVEAEKTVVELPCRDSISLETTVNSSGIDFTAQWTTQDGHILSGAQSLTPLIDAPGTYQLEVAMPSVSTSCREQINISVEEVSSIALSIAEPAVLHCGQPVVDLVASHPGPGTGFAYQWSDTEGIMSSSGNTPLLQVDSPGVYTLTMTELATGCSVSSSAEVRESRLDSFTYRLEPPGCERESGNLFFENIRGGTAPYLYSLDGGSTFSSEPAFPGLPAGTYTLVVQDSYGCELQQEIVLPDIPGLAIDLPSRILLDQGVQYTIPAALSVPDSLIAGLEWAPQRGLNCYDCLQPELKAAESVSYQLEVLDVNGCRASASIRIEVREQSDVYIPNVFSPNQDGVNDRLVLYGNANRIENIRRWVIFNRYGGLVFQGRNFQVNAPAEGWNGELNGRALPSGLYVYLAEIEFSDGRREILSGEVMLIR